MRWLDKSMNQINLLLCSNMEETLQNCCQYYNTNNCAWFQIGKETCHGFGVHHNEHALWTKVSGKTSTFYTTYPSERGNRARSTNANGLFKYLQQYCAAAFSPDPNTIETIQKDHNDGGVFVYTMIERCMNGKVNFRERSIGEKYLDMVAYFFENAYNISLFS